MTIDERIASRVRVRARGIFLFLGLCLGVTVLQAADVSGRVFDPQGLPIGDATVIVASTDGTTTVATDEQGRYEVTGVAVGTVQLEARADGFESRTTNLDVDSEAVEHDVTLSLASARGEILVTATLPALATELQRSGSELDVGGPGDLMAALRTAGGTAAVRRGAINLEPTVRGLQESQVAMLVDGTRTFAAGPARMDAGLSHVNPHAVESLRVVKGPYALAWGAGAMSAVQVDLTRPRYRPNGTAWEGGFGARYGENGEESDAHARLGVGAERWRFGLVVGYRDGDDYEDGDGDEVPARYTSDDALAQIGFAPRENLLIDLSVGYQGQDDLDYAGRLLDATYFKTRAYGASLSWQGGGALDELFVQAYSNRKDHRMNNDAKPTARAMPGRIPPFGLRVDLPTEANTAGGRLRLGWQAGPVAWTAGADAYRLEQTANRRIFRRTDDRLLFDDIVWPQVEIDNLGAYVQAVVHRERSTIGATVRIDDQDASTGEVSPFFAANTQGDTRASDTHLSAAVSSSIDLGGWTLDLGVGRAVRTPTALERYSDRFPATKFQIAAEVMGNPLLDAEVAHEVDVGLATRRGGVRLRLDGFYRVIDDYITLVADPSLPRRLPLSPPVVYRYVNGTEATFYGAELRLDQSMPLAGSSRLSWRLALAYVRGEDDALDEPVLGLMPLNVDGGLRWHGLGERLWIDLAVRWVDRQDRVATSRFEQPTPGYTTADLSARWSWPAGWSLTAGVENLFDEAYAVHLNAPNPFTRQRVDEPGRSVYVGFAYRR